MGTLLVVEDDPSLGALVRIGLETVGHEVTTTDTARAARSLMAESTFDLVVLDIGLPDGEGTTLLPMLRDKGIGVIIITAKDSPADRVQGLDAGADDYLSKPFETLELIARVRAVLRRTGRERTRLSVAGIDIDVAARQVHCDGRRIDLARQEFDLLLCLAEHRNIALTRERLLSLAWGYDYSGATRTVDVHVQRLREKLGTSVIKTVPGTGYRLEA